MAPADLSNAPARTHAHPGISRRRVLVGTAWATPAIMIGVAAPQAAASGGSGSPQAPGMNLVVANNGGAMDVANVTAKISVSTSTPAGASLRTGFTVTITVPKGNQATLDRLTYDPTLWMASPANLPANQTGSVIFTYKGPDLVAPTTAELSVGATFINGLNHNASDLKQRTVTTTLSGTSGGGDAVLATTTTEIPRP